MSNVKKKRCAVSISFDFFNYFNLRGLACLCDFSQAWVGRTSMAFILIVLQIAFCWYCVICVLKRPVNQSREGSSHPTPQSPAPNTATSQPRYPAKGRINRAAPYKSSQGDMYPDGCNKLNKCLLTINPRDDPSDKVSNRIQLRSYSRPCFTISGKNSCMPFHRVSA